MNVDVSLISQIQKNPDSIRNVCILAHVDHGKTTLSDHLIASNGLIHPKLAGELRFLDSKEDEQARGITMKSSSISLLHKKKGLDTGYLFNLIDSPGHIDFCSEVSTAVRLSDGAFIVVDAVEGVCIQTHAVLRQAWEEKLSLCLVINKIDRLILELKLDPLEAYERMKSIISHVNMILSSFRSERYLNEADAILEDFQEAEHGGSWEEEPETEEEHILSPERGTVAFGSAYDGWACTIQHFAKLYASKMGCSATALEKALWGDFSLDPKTKRVISLAHTSSSSTKTRKPLFVQLVLDPLWKAYSVCLKASEVSHTEVLSKMVAGLGLKDVVTERALAHPDPRMALKAMMRAWLPLSDAILGLGVEHLPSPKEAAPIRMPRLLPARVESLHGLSATDDLTHSLDVLESGLFTCSNDEDIPCVAYISKMVAVPASSLPRSATQTTLSSSSMREERFLAFGRVFSGCLKRGDSVYVLPSTYNPALLERKGNPPFGMDGLSKKSASHQGMYDKDDDLCMTPSLHHTPEGAHQSIPSQCGPMNPPEVIKAPVQALYLMMGRGLECLESVPAGNVFAMEGVGHAILKSATLSTTPQACPLAPLLFQTAPIVTVAIEPARPQDMAALERGLTLLHKADPLVSISFGDQGEHLVAAAGEVHLETCVKDLAERFAGIKLLVSAPIVGFKESIVHVREEQERAAEGDLVRSRPYHKQTPVVEVATPSGTCVVRVRALAMRETLAKAVEKRPDSLAWSPGSVDKNAAVDVDDRSAQSSQTFCDHLKKAASESEMQFLLSRIAAFGDSKAASCILLTGGKLPASLPSHGASVARDVRSDTKDMGRHTSREDMLPGSASFEDRKQEEDRGQESVFSTRTLSLGEPVASKLLGLLSVKETPMQACFSEKKAQAQMLGVQHHAELLVCQSPLSNDDPTRKEGYKEAMEEDVSPDGRKRDVYLQHCVQAGVSSGFQLAGAAGPLCDEPLWGVAFDVEAVLRVPVDTLSPGNGSHDGMGFLMEDVYGPFLGQVTSAAKQAFRKAVLESGPRLVESYFLCEITTASEALSAVYAVLGRRRCTILREELKEGSGVFTVLAHMPTEASFGFADELRRKSSGVAAATLMFSHWRRIPIDPFYLPTTEEEREEFGEEGQGWGASNLAKRSIDAVRRRKGLPVEEKVVESATKQRTRARKV